MFEARVYLTTEKPPERLQVGCARLSDGELSHIHTKPVFKGAYPVGLNVFAQATYFTFSALWKGLYMSTYLQYQGVM